MFNSSILKSLGVPILVGIGVVLVAPAVLPVVLTTGRSLAKAALKGGFALADMGKESFAGAYEQMQDLYAEAEAEYKTSAETTNAAAAPAAATVTPAQETI